MKHSKQLLIFGIFAAGITGLIASSPTIYAIVEPHITITMDPGQTTKPLQINDDLGSEVFSVDVDGTISPNPSNEFSYVQTPPNTFITIGTANVQNNPVLIAHWGVDTVPAGRLHFTTHASQVISGEHQKLSGAGSIFVAWCISDDGGLTWDFDATSIGGNQIVVTLDFSTNAGVSVLGGSDTDEVAICGWNTDGSTSGQVRNLSARGSTILASDVVVTELACQGVCVSP